jgi:DNA modification methylase
MDGECLCIPDELCRIAKKIGFKPVNRIIWHVTNRKPQNLKKQLNTSYETIFHFVKDIKKYKHRQLRYKTKEKSVVSKSVGDRMKGNKIETGKRIVISPYSKFRDFIEDNSKCIDVIKSSVATSQELKKETGYDFPAVAPENLGLLFVLQSTNVGDKVMDVCSGSGTFGFCTMFGRKYVGVEISKEYHKIGKERLEYFTNQIDENEINEFESFLMAA